MGAATSRPGERLESVIRRADAAMYEAKRAHYSDWQNDRREPNVSPAPERAAPAPPFSESEVG
jgi:hypothetical protein